MTLTAKAILLQAYVGRDFEDIVVRTNADGTRLLLKDIATIRDEFIERARYSEFNGEPALSIQVLSVGNQSELKIAEKVKTYIVEKQKTLPTDIHITAWADTSYYLKGRLDMMLKNLFFGAALVFVLQNVAVGFGGASQVGACLGDEPAQ